jgi:hypothetical protein
MTSWLVAHKSAVPLTYYPWFKPKNMGLGSEIRDPEKPIPDLGVQKSTRSRIRILNTVHESAALWSRSSCSLKSCQLLLEAVPAALGSCASCSLKPCQLRRHAAVSVPYDVVPPCWDCSHAFCDPRSSLRVSRDVTVTSRCWTSICQRSLFKIREITYIFCTFFVCLYSGLFYLVYHETFC